MLVYDNELTCLMICWLMNEDVLEDENKLIGTALVIYAAYIMTNRYRWSGKKATEEVAGDALIQCCMQGAMGAKRSEDFWNSRWTRRD